MNTRTLAIERTGDFWRGTTKPRIRIAGQWLERAGFKPGHRVEVHLSQPGILTLRFLDQSNPPEAKPSRDTPNSKASPCAVLALGSRFD